MKGVLINLRAVIYARCSTDESRQDVEPQLEYCREYCKRQGWEFNEFYEYQSASKRIPDYLNKILRMIKDRHYDAFVVYDLSRFSRLHPNMTTRIMSFIVDHKCRFISLQDNIDSDDEIKWLLIKPMFQYMSWVYSKNLSEKVKIGMKRAKDKGAMLGRPRGSRDKKQRSKKGYYTKQREKLVFL